MKGFIARVLASLTEGVAAPRGVLVPYTVQVSIESTRTIMRRVR